MGMIEAMMDKMMGKFFEGMTKEDKEKMMPQRMEGMTMMDMMSGMMGGEHGGMMDMVSGMMGDNQGEGIPPMAQMMQEMIPHCLEMMLPYVPKDMRADFAAKLVKSLLQSGVIGMTADEKNEYAGKI